MMHLFSFRFANLEPVRNFSEAKKMISLNKYHFQTADDTDDAQNWQTIIDIIPNTMPYFTVLVALVRVVCTSIRVIVLQGNNAWFDGGGQ